ncbi:unnamed protein product [Rotaria magnacalcarata]|uniref:ADP-ribosylglycohydrolase n=2 Tax=Rotaria magnacalcarata TaxID=392030 RepID=A0A819RQ89_9BILA|nr:unnamed protein product [Rotaria magnacalcarata]CAF2254079.1 unnamed protein product [Rotaria magnacalcarata]CAF4027873.1 unnamed protein product [Rotaria magnacalcarata]CAF4056448.1 unnamed protein product [Rotaria magnacalcarata]
MAKSSSAGNKPKNQENGFLPIIEELLDKKQPYEDFNRFNGFKLDIHDDDKVKKIQGSLIGLAIGDALGASVEFRPHSYLQENKVTDMQEGGTWGLKAGQWTDDTSMALCLAASLIVKGCSDCYDQFERYKRWFKDGYMSSTGTCFDIGKSTRQAIIEFDRRQKRIMRELNIEEDTLRDAQSNERVKNKYLEVHGTVEHGASDSAGNGALMRLAPIPAFFFRTYTGVKNCIENATRLTHGDERAIDACKFYAGLIWHAIDGTSKENLLSKYFYKETLNIKLHKEVEAIAEGSYKEKKKGYDDGIRGKGFVLDSLEAALWAFYNDDGSFEKGVLDAVNLGDDTDTTAAIYGELAGAVYGIENIPSRWRQKLFQENFIMTVAKALYVKGNEKQEFKARSEWPEPNPNENGASGDRRQADSRRTQHTDQTQNKKDASKEQPSPDPSNKSNRPQDSNQKKNQKGSSADNSHPDAPNKTNQPQHNDQTKTHETKSTEKVSSGASNLPNISQSDKNDKRSIQVHQTARRASLDDTQSKKKNPTNDRSIDKLINEY